MELAFALISFGTTTYMYMQDTGKPFQAALMMDIPGFQIQVRHNAGYANLLVYVCKPACIHVRCINKPALPKCRYGAQPSAEHSLMRSSSHWVAATCAYAAASATKL